MKITNGELLEEPKSGLTLKERLNKYLSNWYLFVIIVGICVAGGFLYARYTIPKYMSSTTILIKGSNRPTSNDLVEDALTGKKGINLNNEMLVITSPILVERVVRKGSFNICYYKAGNILDIDIYTSAPFRLIVNDSNENSLPVTLKLQSLTVNGGNGFIGADDKGAPFSFKWNTPFAAGGKKFVLMPSRPVQSGDGNYLATWRPVGWVAGEILMSLSVAPFDTKTSAISASLKSENVERGNDILNTLYNEFNLMDLEDRSKVNDNTARFINDRLALISTELQSVEGNLENFKGNKRLINIDAQTGSSLGGASDMSSKIKDIGVQRGTADMMADYFKNPANSNKLVPTNIGLGDETLSGLIGQYNALQLKREREVPMNGPNSFVIQDLDAQTNNLKSSILENLNNISKTLTLREKDFQRQNSQFESFLTGVPSGERRLQEINRKQSITEGLYVYLLQKKEEMAISGTAATVSVYKQMDEAKGYGPIEPNTRNAILFSALLGIALSVGLIYVKDLFNDKVNNREDVSHKLDLPVFGDVSHITKKEKSPINVLAQGIISEQFRAIRTNLSFVLKNKKSVKTILVTSSSANEGKSFVSLNLAAVSATPGKKVALLEFDIRKPHLTATLNFQSTKGITNYLTGEIDDISEIVHVLDEIPTLHIYPAGPIPLNPADLLLADNVSRLFEALKYQYDYIIVDSPPVGLVSDGLVLGEFSDLVLYIVRQRVTPKKQLDFVNEIYRTGKLTNIGIILNDMKTGGKYGHYTYGYGNYDKSKYKAKA